MARPDGMMRRMAEGGWAALLVLEAALFTTAVACDSRDYVDVAPPELIEVSPPAARAGRVVTVVGRNLELTPWDIGDLPPPVSPGEADPLRPLPYELAVRVGETPADVLGISAGGATIRVPRDLEPGAYDVVVTVEGVDSNAVVLEVAEEPPLEITLVPDPLAVAAATSRRFDVYVLFGDGRVEVIAPGSPLDEALAIEVTDTRIARVDRAAREIAGLVVGRTVLRAVLGVLVDDAGVEVERAR